MADGARLEFLNSFLVRENVFYFSFSTAFGNIVVSAIQLQKLQNYNLLLPTHSARLNRLAENISEAICCFSKASPSSGCMRRGI